MRVWILWLLWRSAGLKQCMFLRPFIFPIFCCKHSQKFCCVKQCSEHRRLTSRGWTLCSFFCTQASQVCKTQKKEGSKKFIFLLRMQNADQNNSGRTIAAVYQSSFHFFSPSVRRGENGLIGGHFFLPEESDGSCRVFWVAYKGGSHIWKA